MKNLIALLVATLAISQSHALPVPTYPVDPVTGRIVGDWYVWGTATFTSNNKPLVIGDFLGFDGADSDGDGNFRGGIPYDNDVIVGKTSYTGDVRMAFTGCLPVTFASTHYIGLMAGDPAFTGASNSNVESWNTLELAIMLQWPQPFNLLITHRTSTTDGTTIVVPSSMVPALTADGYCADYVFERKSGVVTALINGNVAFSASSLAPDAGLTPIVWTYDKPFKFSDFSFGVPFDFDGFRSPIANLPKTNVVKAGSAIPVKFSLGGDMGLEIFEAGYPASVETSCDATELTAELTEAGSPGDTALTYDPLLDQYSFVWKTQSTWGGQCRLLALSLTDGSMQIARFRFK